jgi:DNA-directed RNA polymerase subunit alpha
MERFLETSFTKIVSNKSEETPNKDIFHVEKLERGFGQTLGVSLRRTLISSIPGAAPFAVEVKGVNHEFQPITSAEEDMVELILNIKELIISVDENIIEQDEVYQLKLTSKKGVVKAGDIVVPAGISIINTDLVLANTSKDKAIEMVLYVMYSKGYKTFQENRALTKEQLGDKRSVISIDSNFSPVKQINFKVEEVNPGESRVFERLVLEVETKGNIEPQRAVAFAGAILRTHYSVFENMEEVNIDAFFEEEVIEEEINTQLIQRIDSLNLSVRSENALKQAEIETVEQLIDRSVSDLGDIKNLGEKSKTEIIQIIQDMGLSFKSE